MRSPSYNDVIEALQNFESQYTPVYNYLSSSEAHSSSIRHSLKQPLLDTLTVNTNFNETNENSTVIPLDSPSATMSTNSNNLEFLAQSASSTPSFKHIFLTTKQHSLSSILKQKRENYLSSQHENNEMNKKLSFNKQFSTLFIRLIKVLFRNKNFLLYHISFSFIL